MSSILRVGLFVAVAIAGTVSLGGAVGRLIDLERAANRNASLDFGDRDYGSSGNSLILTQDALYAARSIIPPRARFRVLVGPRLRGGTELTERSLPGFAGYFLLPRRAGDSGEWIICYGCEPAALGARYEAIWSDEEHGISVGRVAR